MLMHIILSLQLTDNDSLSRIGWMIADPICSIFMAILIFVRFVAKVLAFKQDRLLI